MKLFTFPATLPSLFFTPIRYRPNGIGYWSGHIPFACDLAATLRPKVFAELGTHTGESYFAFCQALAEGGVSCQAFAVDTWRGDQHTGSYDESVYSEVYAHNEQHYKSFSRLLRLRFDQAACEFSDESIDLLHIDGAHTYEAVRHDFETWWPKVRSGGVVLLHDAAERQADFGVWRLLEDLRVRRLSVAEFTHSHGLGVVVKPPLLTAHIASIFVRADDSELEQMRRYYEVCADHLQTRYWEGKQQRLAEWEITSQLFWRTGVQAFTEEESVRLAHVVDEKPSTVTLYVPSPEQTQWTELRLHPMLGAAVITIFEVAVLSESGELLWTWNRPEGKLFAGAIDVSIRIPVQLASAASVRLTVAGADPFVAARDLLRAVLPDQASPFQDRNPLV